MGRQRWVPDPAISKPMLTTNNIFPLYAQCHNSIKYLMWKKGTSRVWLSLRHLGTAGVQQENLAEWSPGRNTPTSPAQETGGR